MMAIAEYQDYVQLAVSPNPCLDMSLCELSSITSKIIGQFVVYSTFLGAVSPAPYIHLNLHKGSPHGFQVFFSLD